MFITFCRLTAPGACPSLSAPVAPSSSEKASCSRRRTSTHYPRRLPRLWAESFAALLLPPLRAPVDSTCTVKLFGGRLSLMVSFRRAGITSTSKSVDLVAILATYFASTPESDGAFRVSPLGFVGAFCVSSGSNGAFSVSSPASVSPSWGAMAPLVYFPCDPMTTPVSHALDSMTPTGSPPRDPATLSVPPSLDSMASPVSSRRERSFPRYLIAPPVSLPCDSMAPAVSPPRNPAVSLMSSPQNPAAQDPVAVLVSPLRGLAAPPVFPICILLLPAVAPAPILVLRAAEHLLFRLIRLHQALNRGPHRQHRCCRSCQVRQSTAPPAVPFFTSKRASHGLH